VGGSVTRNANGCIYEGGGDRGVRYPSRGGEIAHKCAYHRDRSDPGVDHPHCGLAIPTSAAELCQTRPFNKVRQSAGELSCTPGRFSSLA
jgi:hypothetical protein